MFLARGYYTYSCSCYYQSTHVLWGTAILIVVGVALETSKQLEAQMLMRHYKGFLNKGLAMISIKSKKELEIMREAGKITAGALGVVQEQI